MKHRPARLAAGFLAMAVTPPAWADDPAPTEPSLRTELEELAAASSDRLPAPMLEKFSQGIDEVRQSGVADSAKNVGDTAPSAPLLGADGKPVELKSLWADGPVVVSFYRGGWCPYCNLQLKALQRSLASIEGAGAKLVAVTPELPEKVSETAAKNDLSFQVLTDKDNRLAREFGIAFKLPEVIRPIYEDRIGLAAFNGNNDNELPLAATYVIDKTGVIRWAWLDADYKKRAEPADIVAAVKEVVTTP